MKVWYSNLDFVYIAKYIVCKHLVFNRFLGFLVAAVIPAELAKYTNNLTGEICDILCVLVSFEEFIKTNGNGNGNAKITRRCLSYFHVWATRYL